MQTGFGGPWAFLGLFTGAGKMALVASIALLLFGKGDLVRRFAPRALRPFLPSGHPARGPLLGPHAVLALKVLAWVALAAWIATRITRIGPALSFP